jgi:hypothetical protein
MRDKQISKLEQKAGNLPIVNLGIILTSDETSGNKTKRFNHFESVFFRIANSRCSKLHFVSTIGGGDWNDACTASTEELTEGGVLHNGMVVYDVFLQTRIFVCCRLLLVLCDNPRAADICSNVNQKG